MKVVSVKVSEEFLIQIDKSVIKHGFFDRTELIRRALNYYLTQVLNNGVEI